MAASPQRRSLRSPFADEPVEIWITRLQQAPSIEERCRAFMAVTTQLEPAAALEHVLRTLDDASGELRAAALNWIANAAQRRWLEPAVLNTEAITAHLPARLRDDDPDVQLAAARACSWLAPSAPELREVAATLWAREDLHPGSQVTLANLCARLPDIGASSLLHLRPLLGAEQSEVREAVAEAFSKLGAEARPALDELVTALDDEEPLVREAAAIALGNLCPLQEPALRALEQALSDEDQLVAAAARQSWERLQS